MKIIKHNKTYHVHVFVTLNNKFRAMIIGPTKEDKFSVTIGGVRWNEGKGQDFKDEIKLCCEEIMRKLNENLTVALDLKVCGMCKKTTDRLYDDNGCCYDCLPF